MVRQFMRRDSERQMKMKAILYARVSSKEQEQEGYSIPAQLNLLREYANKHDLTIVNEFIDVETAKRAGRSSFSEMVKFLKKNPSVRTILCEKTDRLYRNFKDYVIIDDLDIEIHLVKESEVLSKNSKSHQKLIHEIKLVMAKNYIDNLSKETKKGMLQKAETGIYPSYAPLGYTNNVETKSIDIDQKRAPVIQKMYRLYATGNYSLKQVENIAYEDGLLSRSGKRVSKSNIEKILKSPFYYGNFVWNGKLYKGNHIPIVSKQLFEMTQDAFERHNRPKQTKREFAFMGLLTCGKCGCSITAEIKKGKYVYYHCTFSKGKCGNTYIREDKLAEKLGQIVSNITIDGEILEWTKEALRESHKDEKEYHNRQIQALNEQYKKLQTKIDRVYEDKLEGKISEDFWLEKYNQYRKEQEGISFALEGHRNANINYIDYGIRILELAQCAYIIYLKQNFKEKAKLIRILTSNCTLLNGNPYPTYRKPFDILVKGFTRQDWLPG